MSFKPLQAFVVLALTVPVGAWANEDIIKISPDTFMLSRTDRRGIFGDPKAFKAQVFREANEFAERQGKVAIPITFNEVPMGPGRFASFEYQFRVVDKEDPEARRTALVPRADVVVDHNIRNDTNIKVTNETKGNAPKDVYGELIKLDDLRKRGIITEAEFDAMKKKLLSSQ